MVPCTEVGLFASRTRTFRSHSRALLVRSARNLSPLRSRERQRSFHGASEALGRGRLRFYWSCLCAVNIFVCRRRLFCHLHPTTLYFSFLPFRYKLTAVWGGHEGSFLLWTFMLAGWMLAVAVFSRSMPLEFVARVLGVLGLLSVGYLLFMLATSNPFDRIVPLPPADGADLNSALQDFGFIVHPPTLYMGYVGFSVVFAFAMAALLSGRLDAAWARWCRPWANVAWAILTIGIALGSWWAYYELGGGGWWAWDPVENPPLITWLFGTALIHSLAVTEKRGIFKSWTVMLAILAFAGSLLGTFITRSGLLTSVHAFATDPERGVFILAILTLSVGGRSCCSRCAHRCCGGVLVSEFCREKCSSL